MNTQALNISGIPAVIWGQKADHVYLHVHGKMSCKEYAEPFARIAGEKGCQTLSFDLPGHGERKARDERCDIWSGMHDLSVVANYAFSNWRSVSLFACSLGAYFSLNTYADMNFAKCLFQSPVLDMEYLIRQMFLWFSVTEERLLAEQEIPTPVDLLRWDYFQYVLKHPVKRWNIPTAILYGGKDNFQSAEVIQKFVTAHNCQLTISPNSEHPFMQAEDENAVSTWLAENI